MLQSIAALEDGRWGDAVAALQQVTQTYPRFEMGFFFLGLAAYQSADYRAAVRALETALQLQPERSETRSYLAAIALSEEDYQRAARLLSEEIITRFPPSIPEVRNVLATAYLAAGDPKAAAAQCRSALREQPNYVEARYNLGRALVAREEYVEALEEYKAALNTIYDWRSAESRASAQMTSGRRPPELTEETVYESYHFAAEFVREKGLWSSLYKAMGDACAAAELYEDARNFYRRALLRTHHGDPDDPDAHTRIGMCTYKEALKRLEGGDVFSPWNLLQAARAHFEEAIDREPTYAEAYCGLGLVFLTEATRYREGMAEEIVPHSLSDAVEQFQEAIDADPNNVAAWVDLAQAQRLDGQYGQALVSATRALSLADPRKQPQQWVRAQTEVAQCLYGLGRFEEAVLAAQRALQVDKTYAPAFIVAGKAEIALRKYGDAMDSLTVASHRDPRNVEVRALLGDVLRELASWVRARQRYKEALDLLPKAEMSLLAGQRSRLLFLIGDCYLREHNFARALEFLNQSLSLDPGNYLAEKDLADAYLGLKRYDAAEAALEIALDLSPSLVEDGEIFVRLAQLAEKRGLAHQAYRNYLAALRADPQNPVARAQLEALEK